MLRKAENLINSGSPPFLFPCCSAIFPTVIQQGHRYGAWGYLYLQVSQALNLQVVKELSSYRFAKELSQMNRRLPIFSHQM